jgi:protein N-terminal methyltransferase
MQIIIDFPSIGITVCFTLTPQMDIVLGGFSWINGIDLSSSQIFLLAHYTPKGGRALDCGAGIGRVAKELSKNFAPVDLVEPNPSLSKQCTIADRVWNCRLEEFIPQLSYEIIWIQWVLLFVVEDEQIVQILKRLAEKSEVIFVKENVLKMKEGQRIIDEADSSVTRSRADFESIFTRAGLQIIAHCADERLARREPRIFPVHMYLLKKNSPTIDDNQ